MKAVLPIAGGGTRMYPLGVTTPKALMPILNKPMILWSIEALEMNGIDEIILVISGGKFGQHIKQYVEKHIMNSDRRAKISFTIQKQQLGTAHVLQEAKNFFDKNEEFIFLYGDDLYSPKLIEQVISCDSLSIIGKKVDDPEKWGIFITDKKGWLEGLVEKPTDFVGNLANTGCSKLNSVIFNYFDKLHISVRGEYELTDSFLLLSKDYPVKILEAKDYWIPVGYPWHILDATEFLLPRIKSDIKGKVDSSSKIKGNLILPESSQILENCSIEGHVMIGENCVIGPNASIRGNTVIGSDSEIGFSVEIKNSVLGEECKINHLTYIGDSILGNKVTMAAGSNIANLRHDHQHIFTPIKGNMTDTNRVKFGAVIGDNAKIGINNSIYPGRKIWPGATTRPGEIVDKDIIIS